MISQRLTCDTLETVDLAQEFLLILLTVQFNLSPMLE